MAYPRSPPTGDGIKENDPVIVILFELEMSPCELADMDRGFRSTRLTQSAADRKSWAVVVRAIQEVDLSYVSSMEAKST